MSEIVQNDATPLKTQYEDLPTAHVHAGSTPDHVQAPFIRTFTTYTLRAHEDNSKGVLLSLAADGKGNTLFSPGSLLYHNAHQGMAYYVDQLIVKITCDTDYMLLSESFPTALDQNGNTGTSQGISDGFFGGTATGSYEKTVSSSRQLQDFVLTDHSDDKVLLHQYDLQMCGDGTHYTGPRSLQDAGTFGWGHFRDLPALAVGDFPLIDLGVWVTPKDRVYNDMLRFTVNVYAHMSAAVNTVGNSVEAWSHGRGADVKYLQVPLSDVVF